MISTERYNKPTILVLRVKKKKKKKKRNCLLWELNSQLRAPHPDTYTSVLIRQPTSRKTNISYINVIDIPPVICYHVHQINV